MSSLDRTARNSRQSPDHRSGVGPGGGTPCRKRVLRESLDIELGQVVHVQPAGAGPDAARVATLINATDRFIVLSLHEAPSSVRGKAAALKPPRRGTEVEVTLNREADARYRFDSRVLKVAESLEGVFCLAHAPEMTRVQTRRYLRVPVGNLVVFTPVSESCLLARELTGHNTPGREHRRGRIIDISGGGCGLRLSTSVVEGDYLLLLLDFIRKDELIKAPAQIRRFYRISGTHGPSFRAHLMFRHIPESLRRQIVKFAFDRQLHSPNQ